MRITTREPKLRAARSNAFDVLYSNGWERFEAKLRFTGNFADPKSLRNKNTDLRDRHASIVLQLEALNRTRDENAELASRVFELSQTLSQKWLTAEYEEKRQILEIVWLNCRLDDVTLVPTIRKPFDVLAEGLLVPDSGG